MTAADVGIAALGLAVSFLVYRLGQRRLQPSTGQPARAYVLQSAVTHARLLPADSAHAFTYPTLSFLVSLSALESGSLDLGLGFIFSYGGIRGRLTGIRPTPYFFPDSPTSHTIRAKLIDVINWQGLSGEELDDAWMMTMPSFCGLEGINPLTVYFCYKPGGVFWLAVLEIHNTFGESHVHVLEAGKEEDKISDASFDHQWTFLRDFHVSPFNDRSGFYTVSVKSPSHPPSGDSSRTCPPPRPMVRVHLHTSSPGSDALGPLKLTALLRPHTSRPLTTANLVSALAHTPLALALSFPRIVYQAYILHYWKRLDVYVRPEPHSTTTSATATIVKGGGVRWQPESFLEGYARRRLEHFLRRRVEATGVGVSIISGDSRGIKLHFEPSSATPGGSREHLTVTHLSPRFYTLFLLAPSPAHALLLSSSSPDPEFSVSSRELFIRVFSAIPADTNLNLTQRLRTSVVPSELLDPPLSVPAIHPIDTSASTVHYILTLGVVSVMLCLGALERWIFSTVGARFVEGQEPWKAWDRAAASLRGSSSHNPPGTLGSVRRAQE